MKSTSRWIAVLFLPVFAAHAQTSIDCPGTKAPDPANATYTIEGDAVTLAHGARSQPVAPGSHTMHDTRLIEGAQTCGEFDNQPTVAVLLSDNPGGSGAYIYVGAVQQGGAPIAAALIGDRIEPKSIVIANGLIVVTYLDRPANAPMSTAPSVVTVRKFGLQHGHLMDMP